MVPHMYPKNIDPVSPIKIDAGLKLNGKNPNTAPNNANAREIRTGSITSIPSLLGSANVARYTANIKYPIDIIPVTPEHNPTSPSKRFVALQVAPITHTVTKAENT